MRKDLESFAELGRFAGPGIDFLDLVVLKAKKVEALEFSGLIAGKVNEFGFGLLDRSEKAAHSIGKGRGFGKRIDHAKLASGIQESLLFVLAMNVQQDWCQFTESRNRDRLVVDIDSIAIVLRDFPADNNLGVLRIETKAIQFQFDVAFKDGFDHGARFAGANHLGGRFSAGQQPQGIDDDRFTRAGFSGQKVKTFSKMQFEMVDQSKISHAKEAQHNPAVISHRG
jgi:hypothetical protein